MSIYRRIYEQKYGPIPRDSEGRTYDIHHIDGNRKNNDPYNLIALSKQSHYELHLSQGDKSAAFRLANELKRTPEEISELSRESQLERVKNGTHHFLGGELQRKQIENGTHPFIKNNPVYKMIDDGTHHFLGGELQRNNARKRIKEGTHHLLGGELQRKQIEQGKHPSQIVRTCPHCGKVGKGGGMIRFHFENCKERKI